MAVAKHPLLGMYFHTFADDGWCVRYQGQIIAVKDGHVLVQLFDWITGANSIFKWCSLTTVETWNLYESEEHMHFAYRNLKERQPKTGER